MNGREAAPALLALGVAPLTSVAQQARKVWRIGFLFLSAPETAEPRLGSPPDRARRWLSGYRLQATRCAFRLRAGNAQNADNSCATEPDKLICS